jgi:hypothetical protein
MQDDRSHANQLYVYTLDEGKRGWYGAFLVYGPLAEYLAEKLKKGAN